MPTFIKINTDHNERRFYAAALTRDLFEGWTVVREWGRIGSAGTVRQDRFKSETEARATLATTAARRKARGYIPSPCDP
jgi:predicted DNA-binding WGR domain protein